jgi:hypothetical protein
MDVLVVAVTRHTSAVPVPRTYTRVNPAVDAGYSVPA